MKLLKEMLTENTGIAMCDSGGSDGRHWQRNQGRDFDSEPEVTYEIYNGEIDFTVNVYHYLRQLLEVDEVCEEFNKLKYEGEPSENIYGISEEQEQWLYDNDLARVGKPFNTYNYDCSLSQTLQGHLLDNDYIILQIHQGCDVRGGYTDGKLFKLRDGCYLEATPHVYGDIDGRPVSTCYNGYQLRWDDDETEIENLTGNEKVNLCLGELQ